ncbi:enoyl-CoA hydratase/isomerase family protein [Lentibacillus sediminis]|uniref:enoyl-CoA hydratase/isomerase family protein n=1 Tax=Lentibacillus sediminis TaxID=1940529 RepID=UPI000C1C2883|nr:enoyl-CoA hydratase/isomerase family protein [Lentibacillus sediminis]
MTEEVLYQRLEAGYGEICLNRPAKRHAISAEMTALFKKKLDQARQDQLKFLVITASGDDLFCAGGDLHYLHGELTAEEALCRLSPMKELLYEIAAFPVPTICLLNGNAFGGGCEIATACDIRIAREKGRFGFIQSTIGIIPGWGGGALLYEKVAPDFAFQWLMEGNVFSAPVLKERGWIHHLAAEEVWANRESLLEPYTSKSHKQMKILKAQYKNKLSISRLSSLMNEEVESCASLWDSPEHKEAVRKFILG